jgi:preprotein translocase subunit SecG
MFPRILLGLLILDSLILIAAVLLQSGKGGGLAANFGGVTSSADAILGTRQAGNILTKISWWCGGLFLALAFMLSLASTQQAAPRSILDQTFSPQPVQPAPATTPNTPASNILPVQPAPTGDTKTPAPTKTP